MKKYISLALILFIFGFLNYWYSLNIGFISKESSNSTNHLLVKNWSDDRWFDDSKNRSWSDDSGFDDSKNKSWSDDSGSDDSSNVNFSNLPNSVQSYIRNNYWNYNILKSEKDLDWYDIYFTNWLKVEFYNNWTFKEVKSTLKTSSWVSTKVKNSVDKTIQKFEDKLLTWNIDSTDKLKKINKVIIRLNNLKWLNQNQTNVKLYLLEKLELLKSSIN